MRDKNSTDWRARVCEICTIARIIAPRDTDLPADDIIARVRSRVARLTDKEEIFDLYRDATSSGRLFPRSARSVLDTRGASVGVDDGRAFPDYKRFYAS